MNLIIPESFKKILASGNENYSRVILNTYDSFKDILNDKKMSFFNEYTPHDITHINSVLKSASELIPLDTYKILSSKDITFFILAVLLHDLGMQIEYETFISLINGKYDKILNCNKHFSTKNKTWNTLWNEYLKEMSLISDRQRRILYGKSDLEPEKNINLNEKETFTETHKKLIGEFIRRNHPRFAHEVALIGYHFDNFSIDFANTLNNTEKDIIGLIARSHGIEIRDTYSYLKSNYSYMWQKPLEVNVFYLMVLLRISDYLQIDKDRIDTNIIRKKIFNSSISETEHIKHIAVEAIIQPYHNPETLYIHAIPNEVTTYVSLDSLFKSIQYELDTSWAILGEMYGNLPSPKQPKLKYRRITSSIYDDLFLENFDYIPKAVKITQHPDLAKLLIKPLYGNDPTFGVRELLQNSVDACLERERIENVSGSYDISVSIIENSDTTIFKIEDKGKGMTLYEITNYFLVIGSSYRNDFTWRSQFINTNGNVILLKSGRFGIGVLASFLLGDNINVKTRSINDPHGYEFNLTTDNLNDDLIEIRRNYNLDIGTIIEINLTSHSIHNLKNPQDRHWKSWYSLDYPRVSYNNPDSYDIQDAINTDNFTFPYITEETNDIWQKEHFNGITYFWTYFPIHKHYKSGKLFPHNNNVINVNGFPITRTSSYTSWNSYYEFPSAIFYDYNSKLDISLSRKDFVPDGELFFKISQESAEDFIACLLCLPNDINTELYTRMSHPGFASKFHGGYNQFLQKDTIYNNRILYCNKGYTTVTALLFCNYQSLLDYNVVDILCNTNNDVIEQSLKGPIYFYVDRDKLLKYKPELNYLENNILIGFGCDSDKPYDCHEIIDNSLINELNFIHPEMIIYNKEFSDLKQYVKNFSQYNNIANGWDNIFNTTTHDFIEYEGHYTFSTFISALQNSIFTNLNKHIGLLMLGGKIKEYLGEDPIIPFDFEDRKKKFPVAFDLLKNKTQKYIDFWHKKKHIPN